MLYHKATGNSWEHKPQVKRGSCNKRPAYCWYRNVDMTLNEMIEMHVMESFNPGENMRKMLDIDTSGLEEKNPSTSNRSRPYDF